MSCYIICIGDELLIGQTVNTNASFLGEHLSANNFSVKKVSVIGDSIEEIHKELDLAFKEAEIIITTGGLGPTHDDKTRDAITEYFHTSLTMNKDVLQDIQNRFDKFGRNLTELNKTQALVPNNAFPIRNFNGTAPGFFIKHKGKFLFVLPGVPVEMKAMFNEFVLPKIVELKDHDEEIILRKTLSTTGIPESLLFERLGNLDELLDGAQLAFLPNQYGVKMRITAKGNDEESVMNHILSVEQKIRAKVGRYIYSTSDETLAEVVGKILNERGLTIAVAESCTGGSVSNEITNISGSSKYFERGVISYSNAAKVELLQVDEDLIAKHGAVSYEVARQMAEGIKAISGTDIGVSITGILGPTGATLNKPIGTVFIGYCDRNVCTAKRIQLGENRILNKQRATQAALDIIRRSILGIEDVEQN